MNADLAREIFPFADPTDPAVVASMEKNLADAEANLAEFQAWKKNKPAGVWFHRSAGTWARVEIKRYNAWLRAVKG